MSSAILSGSLLINAVGKRVGLVAHTSLWALGIYLVMFCTFSYARGETQQVPF